MVQHHWAEKKEEEGGVKGLKGLLKGFDAEKVLASKKGLGFKTGFRGSLSEFFEECKRVKGLEVVRWA